MTRGENLKKINDELEKLSDDKLENIAGGTDTPPRTITLTAEQIEGILVGLQVNLQIDRKQ